MLFKQKSSVTFVFPSSERSRVFSFKVVGCTADVLIEDQKQLFVFEKMDGLPKELENFQIVIPAGCESIKFDNIKLSFTNNELWKSKSFKINFDGFELDVVEFNTCIPLTPGALEVAKSILFRQEQNQDVKGFWVGRNAKLPN